MGQGAHQGSAIGKNLCTLPHSLNCPGGIVEDDSYRACPPGYTFHGQVFPESAFLNTMNQSDFISSTPATSKAVSGSIASLYQDHRLPARHQLNLNPAINLVPPPPSVSATMAETQAIQVNTAPPVITVSGLILPPVSQPTTGSAQSSLLVSRPNSTEAYAQATGGQPPLHSGQALHSNPSYVHSPAISADLHTVQMGAPTYSTSTAATVVTNSIGGQIPTTVEPNQDSLVYDLLRLSLQQMGEGARAKVSAVQNPTTQSLHSLSNAMQLQVNSLRAANQVARSQDNVSDGLNIADLRALPALQGIVGNQLNHLRAGIPALSAAKSAPAPGIQDPLPTQGIGQAQPMVLGQSVPTTHHKRNQYMSAPAQSLGCPSSADPVQGPCPQQEHGSANFLPSLPLQQVGQFPLSQQTVHQFLQQQQQQLLQLNTPHINGGQSPQYRLEYRCSPRSGRTFQVAVPVSPSPAPAPVPETIQYEWRCDPLTGSTYQVPVQVQKPDTRQVGCPPSQTSQLSHPFVKALEQQHLHAPLQAVHPTVPGQMLQAMAPSVVGQQVPLVPRQPTQAAYGASPHPQQPVHHHVLGQDPSYVVQHPQPYQLVHTATAQAQLPPVAAQVPGQPLPHMAHQPSYQPSQQFNPQSLGPQPQQVVQQSQQQHDHSASLLQAQQNQTLAQFQQQYPSPYLGPDQVAQQASSTEAQDRLKGITPLNIGGATKKMTKVIDFARTCPVKWAKSAKSENINLPLYTYGALTEIEAALSGRGEPLDDEILLAKVRHLKNINEICCLNSTPTDFSTYGWKIARDYAMKVEEEVEQRFVSWQDMMPGVRTQTLILSQMEHPRQLDKKRVEVADPKAGKKERCTTFNTCTTEMKCDYEVANPGRTCLRKHECSWCRSNLQQGYKHQAWKCMKKQAADQ